MSEHDFEVVHRAGLKNQAFEALSQLEPDGTGKTPLKDDIHKLLASLNQHIDTDNEGKDASSAEK